MSYVVLSVAFFVAGIFVTRKYFPRERIVKTVRTVEVIDKATRNKAYRHGAGDGVDAATYINENFQAIAVRKGNQFGYIQETVTGRIFVPVFQMRGNRIQTLVQVEEHASADS